MSERKILVSIIVILSIFLLFLSTKFIDNSSSKVYKGTDSNSITKEDEVKESDPYQEQMNLSIKKETELYYLEIEYNAQKQFLDELINRKQDTTEQQKVVDDLKIQVDALKNEIKELK